MNGILPAHETLWGSHLIGDEAIQVAALRFRFGGLAAK
jgi:hypothetical protein